MAAALSPASSAPRSGARSLPPRSQPLSHARRITAEGPLDLLRDLRKLRPQQTLLRVDHHVHGAAHAVQHPQVMPHRLARAPPHPVALHRSAQRLGDGEADAHAPGLRRAAPRIASPAPCAGREPRPADVMFPEKCVALLIHPLKSRAPQMRALGNCRR